MSFESRKAAEERNAKIQKQQKKKDHTGNINAMNWDKEGLKMEVESYSDDVQVNWSSLARRFGVKNKKGEYSGNGGQILKQYLTSEGVNVAKFKRKNDEQENKEKRIRRKKLRGLGGK